MNKNENIERTNPFFEPYNTPHDTAPFDRIRLEDYEATDDVVTVGLHHAHVLADLDGSGTVRI